MLVGDYRSVYTQMHLPIILLLHIMTLRFFSPVLKWHLLVFYSSSQVQVDQILYVAQNQ